MPDIPPAVEEVYEAIIHAHKTGARHLWTPAGSISGS